MTGTFIGGYFLSQIIIRTHNSHVYESYHPESCAKLAIKLLKNNTNKKEHNNNEININNDIDCCYIMPVIDIITDVPSQYYSALVMNLAIGGDLYSFISDVGGLDEEIASQVIHAGLMALQYLHINGICHRDVKPDNFFLMDENEQELDIVLGDLGFAAYINEQKFTDYTIGNIYFNAPEIHMHIPYDETIDIWSLGVTMYTILAGEFPFPEDENVQNTVQNIINGQYNFDDIIWNNISEFAKDLIKSMLQTNPNDRISIEQALQHQWFSEYYKEYGRQNNRFRRFKETQFQVQLPKINEII